MKHEVMARKANLIVEYLRQQESLFESVDVADYIKATEALQTMSFSFKDVQMLLFTPKLNLVALHYCIMHLDLPAQEVMEALSNSKIEKRQVCVQRKKLRGLLGLIDSPDRLHFVYCLESFAKSGVDVFLLLQRGVYNNWLQIQISAADC